MSDGSCSTSVDRILRGADAVVLCLTADHSDHPELAAVETRLRLASGSVPQPLFLENRNMPVVAALLGADIADGRRQAAQAVGTLRKMKVEGAAIVIPSRCQLGDDPELKLQAIAEGAFLANHDFVSRAFPRSGEPALRLGFTFGSGWESAKADRALERARAIADAAALARDLCTEPPNVMTPPHFAARMRELATEAGLSISIMGRAELEKQGMGGLLAVASGSAFEPLLIRIDYRPEGVTQKPVVLVGKTVTFDSGGISLKQAHGMEQMKADMGGGAAVAGAMQAVARLKPDLAVTAIFAVAENMPGPNAMRPGDVLRTHSGKTVEVINTDAEGRLILADALSYARSLEPQLIIDLATLTGATMGIFGPLGIATFSTAPSCLSLLIESDRVAGEKIWPMPLWDEYLAFLESPVADLRNFSKTGQMGSTPVAAMFLKQFVGDAPWLHLDLYNTCWSEQPHVFGPSGPTGSGTRVLTQFVLALADRETTRSSSI